jgi:hypothetical protein
MQKSVWGPATWKLLHTLVLKINDNITYSQLIDLKNIILRILHNLPCPYCTSHALSYISASNYKSINNINDLRIFIFNFHNNVNKRLNKPIITYEEHVQLYNISINIVGKQFIYIYSNNNKGITMMLYNYHRKQMINDLINYFKANHKLFN